MIVRVVTPPGPVVTWEEAQVHLRVDGEEQAYVESLVAAATGWLDGPSGWLGRCIGLQTLELVASAFGADRLPFPPLVEVTGISYLDTDGAQHEMSSGDWVQLLNGSIVPPMGQNWLAVGSSPEAVRVVFQAGYPDGQVPAAIKQAILLIVGHWYRNRETVITGTIVAEMPFAAQALLSTYRVWSV